MNTHGLVGKMVMTMVVSAAVLGGPADTRAQSTGVRVINGVCSVVQEPRVQVACGAWQAFRQVKSIIDMIGRLWTCDNRRPKFTWHTQSRTWSDGVRRSNRDCVVGLKYDRGQESRVSANFDRSAIRSRGGAWVYMYYMDVRSSDRFVRFTIMADKPGRPDRARSNAFSHGQWVWVSSGTSGDCGYYVARTNGMSRSSFFSRNPDSKILMIMD